MMLDTTQKKELDTYKVFLTAADCSKVGDFVTAVDYMLHLQMQVKFLATNGQTDTEEYRMTVYLSKNYFCLLQHALREYKKAYAEKVISTVEEIFKEKFVRK